MRLPSVLTAGVATFLVVAAASAQRSIPMTLEGLVRQAGVIVHGRVIATETGRDPRTGLPATWTTIEVREDLYGAGGSTIRYKQYGGEADGMVTPTPDIPRLRSGEELVLMLYPPSKQTGFQSPVGMAQGVFRIGKKGSTERVAQAIASPQLFKTSSRPAAGPVRDGSMELDDFMQILRRTVQEVKP
jgi:hypothetical protein